MAATHWYGVPFKNFVSGVANSSWDWDTDTIKVALTTSTYAVNQDTHAFFSDVTNEVVGTGYTAGGVAISGPPTITYDTASNEIRLDCTDPSWSGASFTARYGIIYKATGVASTSPLIAYIDFTSDQTVASGTFTIVLDATGALKATAS